MELHFVNKTEAGHTPCFEVNLEPTKTAEEVRVGWGEPWHPNIYVSTGTLPDGTVHIVRLFFDTDKEAEAFLRIGMFQFANPQALAVGIVDPLYSICHKTTS